MRLALVAFALVGCAAAPPRADCGGDCQPCCPSGPACYGAPTVICLMGGCSSGLPCLDAARRDAGPPSADATPPIDYGFPCGHDCEPCCPGGICIGGSDVICLGGATCASGIVCDAGARPDA